ncbi:dTDP-4-dehydrorhamnose 3,5-epimerase [Paenibacillus herberti]|uniref:dTDP-4-dehydrorhamnose 3,5-epimerase n=1 Tax=Paenibacillus herberti TaxID=1619309 RepID=A0A229NW66_9BACL|nr:dTDP-4-dehydrorhamnose 3,5-epimerase [Paenibacillus herberti]OXM14117.1 dTDP-4-dehydrorhamnose 3,5-epimerase [Paenibacillus herberti]
MKVKPTPLHKAVIFELEPIEDQRGFFARTFCKKTLAEQGLNFDVVQTNVAFNRHRNTLRGMHFQRPPYSEDKIVSCISGALYDVIIDLNSQSPTFGQWFGVTLTAENRLSLYVPKGFAHGYLTLSEDTTISYMVSQYYTSSHESGVRWDDKAFQIQWPEREGLIISLKDQNWNDFKDSIGSIFSSEGD